MVGSFSKENPVIASVSELEPPADPKSVLVRDMMHLVGLAYTWRRPSVRGLYGYQVEACWG